MELKVVFGESHVKRELNKNERRGLRMLSGIGWNARYVLPTDLHFVDSEHYKFILDTYTTSSSQTES